MMLLSSQEEQVNSNNDNLPSLSMDRHQQLASWSQRDQRLRDHVGPGQEAELTAGQDCRQDELRFDERKLIADTHARASPKGEVVKAMTHDCALCRETLRVVEI